MANIKLTPPGEPFSGQIVTFTAPCGCDQVTDGLVINGETYTVCDAMGECVTGKGGAWCAGAQVSVVLDCENKKAYIQNAAGGSGGVNPNLLHNWYFANCVNQRGQTAYTGAVYTIDGWKMSGASSESVVNDGYVTCGAGTTFQHPLEAGVIAAITGVPLTFSILMDTGLVYGTATYDGSAKSFYGNENTSVRLRISGGGHPYITANTAVNIIAAKLELGSTQTLAHQENGAWVLNEIPDFNDERLKCCMSTADPSDTYANNNNTPAAINASHVSHTHTTDNITDLTSVLSSYGKIQTGTYTGTGTSGSSNKSSLTFNFTPKVVIIYKLGETFGGSACFTYGETTVTVAGGIAITPSWATKSLAWYSTSAIDQFNHSGSKYGWIALG